MPPELRPEVEPSYIEWCDALQLHTRWGGRQFRPGDFTWSYGPRGDFTAQLGDPRYRWLPGLSDWVERLFAIPVNSVIVTRAADGDWGVSAATVDDQLVTQRAAGLLEADGRLCVQLTDGQL